MNDESIKHLEFIQGVIARMNSNSFLIKGWMITLVAALFALAAKDANNRYILITYLIIPAFWLLDAFYLSFERQYRLLYDKVRSSQTTDFSMNISSYKQGPQSWPRAFFSKTLLAFYLPVLSVTLLIMFWIGRQAG